ncbi:Superinfection immunity protein (fragment) [Frankia canadensis]|uniref:Superinfection immunity protein n=1 Tax=Frankia canadensis TaxID=1836972 RepID=A0A2I2KZK8_9ACTN
MKAAGLLFLVVLVALYFVPSVIAMVRQRQSASVIVINVFLGWTLIGWVVALALAVSSNNAKAAPGAAGYPPGYPPVPPLPPGSTTPQPWYPQTSYQPNGSPWDQNPTAPQQYWQGGPDPSLGDPRNPQTPGGSLPPS